MEAVKLIFVIVLFSVGFAAKAGPTEIDSLRSSMRLLQKQVAEQAAVIEVLQAQKDNIGQYLENTSASLENDFKRHENDFWEKTWWISFIGGFTILSLLYFWISRTKMVRDEMVKQIANLTKSDRAIVEALIASKDHDYRLKKEKSVLVLTNDLNGNNLTVQLLNGAGFKKIMAQSPTEYIDYGSFDITIFDDSEGKGNHDLFKNYIVKQPSAQVLYFGSGRLDAKTINMNYSNSKFTLEEQVLKVLRTP